MVAMTHHETEAAWNIGQDKVLVIQTCDDGYDYTLYDKNSGNEIDGGQIDNPDMSMIDALRNILEAFGLVQLQVGGQEAPPPKEVFCL